MKIISLITILLPILASANCPLEININNQSYCVDVRWDMAEIKNKGQYSPTEQLSPFLIPMMTAPQKWHYSKASIMIWEATDLSKQPIEIPNFKVFPFMYMGMGHAHGATHAFSFDTEKKNYTLSQMAFRAMKGEGCWALRWSLGDLNNEQESQLLSFVSDFNNLSDQENHNSNSYCESLSLD